MARNAPGNLMLCQTFVGRSLDCGVSFCANMDIRYLASNLLSDLLISDDTLEFISRYSSLYEAEFLEFESVP